MKRDEDIIQFYHEYDEDSRMARNSIEFIRSKEIIARYVSRSPMVIGDLSGGTGPYSYWLAEQGHEVHLMDLSEKHVRLAAENSRNHPRPLASIRCGDARSLPYGNGTFDLVLLMGALYHLQEREDRILCIRETDRVLKAGGTAVFASISRYASLIDGFLQGYVNDPRFREIMDTDLKSGRHNNPGNKPGYFTTAYFHSPEEIIDELRSASFPEISLFAVEGFTGAMKHDHYLDKGEKERILLHYLRLTEQNKDMMGVSPHLLAVCKKH